MTLLPFQVFNSSLSTDESTGPGSLNAAVTDGARIMESQVVNKTSKMLVTHALDMTAEQPVNSQYSILSPFNRMIDIGLDAAKNLKEAAEVTTTSHCLFVPSFFQSFFLAACAAFRDFLQIPKKPFAM